MQAQALIIITITTNVNLTYANDPGIIWLLKVVPCTLF